MKKFYIVLAALFLISVATACTGDNGDNNDTGNNENNEPTPVETSEATKGDLVSDRSVFGRMMPSGNTPVLPSQPGEIDSLEVKNGDKVEEDDTIATITSRAGEETIKAPEDGTIINLNAQEGSMASNEEPLAVVADLGELTLQMNVTASVQALFDSDETYAVTAEGKDYDADINSIGVTPNDQGLYTVEATLVNEDDALLPGMVAELTIPETQVEDAVLIPTAAIVDENDGTFVYVVNDGTVSKTEIETTDVQSDKAAVKNGVTKGDEVVTSGQMSLKDNSEINVVKEGESS